MKTMLRYVINQILWLISVTFQLLAAMGIGFKWITMAIRLFTFAALDLTFFIPHLCWFLLSPSVIRRVAYRSSPKTKKQNLEVFLQRVTRAAAPPTNNNNNNNNNNIREEGDVEFLASTLNPADGRVMSGLPQNPMNSGLMNDIPQLTGIGSFSDTVSFIQKYYSDNAEALTAAGEKKNPDWISNTTLMDANFSGESEEDDEDEEDRKNLHNRATLDIYLPVPLDSLFRMMEQEKMMSSRSRLQCKKFPVVIVVNGGAWIIGSNLWSFLIGRLLSARGYVVFCPDYRNFPQTDMEGMVLDVSDAIKWVLQNAERYNGDLKDVTLVGQSAGAHLTMMSLLSQAQLHAQSVVGGPAPSKMAYNVQRYNPRQSIHRYVGLSGIYNLRGLVKHFHRRGLYSRVLYQIAGGRANMPRYSLNSYFDERRCSDTGEVIPSNIFDFFPQRMFFIHGDADCSAPVSESANLAFVMRNAQRARLAEHFTTSSNENFSDRQIRPVVIEYILVPGATHTDAIIEECLSAKASHLVDFLYLYSTDDAKRGQELAGIYNSRTNLAHIDEDDGQIVPAKNPDGTLWTPAPHGRRPLLIRLGSYVCPF